MHEARVKRKLNVVREYRRRYIRFEVTAQASVRKNFLQEALNRQFRGLFGEGKMIETLLKVMFFIPEKNSWVLLCNHKALPNVKDALTSLTSIEGKPCRIRVRRVSGTLKSLRTHLGG